MLDVGVLLLCVEAGAGFLHAREVSVATDPGLGEELMQGAEEEVEGDQLLGGAVVFEDPPIPP